MGVTVADALSRGVQRWPCSVGVPCLPCCGRAAVTLSLVMFDTVVD
jgi:hypothetical protein